MANNEKCEKCINNSCLNYINVKEIYLEGKILLQIEMSIAIIGLSKRNARLIMIQ